MISDALQVGAAVEVRGGQHRAVRTEDRAQRAAAVRVRQDGGDLARRHDPQVCAAIRIRDGQERATRTEHSNHALAVQGRSSDCSRRPSSVVPPSRWSSRGMPWSSGICRQVCAENGMPSAVDACDLDRRAARASCTQAHSWPVASIGRPRVQRLRRPGTFANIRSFFRRLSCATRPGELASPQGWGLAD